MSKSQTVYPVPGFFIDGVPAVEHECSDAFCVESGAFVPKKPPKSAGADKQPEDPADAGSLDSQEN